MRAWRESSLLRWLVPVVLVIAAFASVAVHVPRDRALSPLDEYVYVDYLAKVPSEGVVAEGESTGPFAREALVCRGNRGVTTVIPTTCARAGSAPSSIFPMAGKTSADIYTPLYFWVTRALAEPLVWAGVGLIDAGSYVGAIWLSAGLLLLVFAMRRFRVREAVILGLGLLLVASPAAYWSSTYISTDAPSLAVGAALMLLVARFAMGDRGLWLVPIVSAVGVAFKVQNLGAVAIAALSLILISIYRSVWPSRDTGRGIEAETRADRRLQAAGVGSGGHLRRLGKAVVSRTVLVAVVSVSAGVAVQAVWLVIRAHLQVGAPPSQGTAQPLHTSNLVQESLKFLQATPLDPTGVDNGIAIATAGVVLSWLVLSGVLGSVAVGRLETAIRPIAWSALTVALAFGPLLVLGTTLVSGYYFVLPTRYGISMLPAFMILSGDLFSRRHTLGVLVAVVGFAFWALSLTGS